MSLDPVARFLYPNNAPVTHEPVPVRADGNCFFRAMAMSLTGKEEITSNSVSKLQNSSATSHGQL